MHDERFGTSQEITERLARFHSGFKHLNLNLAVVCAHVALVGSQGLDAPLVLFMARTEFDGGLSGPLMRLDLAHKRGPPGPGMAPLEGSLSDAVRHKFRASS